MYRICIEHDKHITMNTIIELTIMSRWNQRPFLCIVYSLTFTMVVVAIHRDLHNKCKQLNLDRVQLEVSLGMKVLYSQGIQIQ